MQSHPRRLWSGVWALIAVALLAPTSALHAQAVPIVDTEPPQIEAPPDLQLPNGTPLTLVPAYVVDFTEIAPDGIAITDNSGNATALPEGLTGPFPTGSHTLTWTATDFGNNTDTIEQTISITPQAYFGADQVVLVGGTAQITAYLTGMAANYPVTIPYTINPDTLSASTGELIIDEPQTSASFSIDVAAETAITVSMQTPTNALPGFKTEHTVTAVSGNIPPIVRLRAQQNGVPTRDIFSAEGEVEVIAEVRDLNAGDTLSFDWSASDNALVPLGGIFAESFSFNPSELVEGRYIARVTVSDGIDSNTAELALDLLGDTVTLADDIDSDGDGIDDAADGPGDDDNDGIPNFLDALETAWWLPGWPASNVVPGLKSEDTFSAGNLEVTWQASNVMSPLVSYFLLIVTDPGLELALGPVAQAGYAQARVPISDAQTALGVALPDDRRSAEGYIVDVEVNGLTQPGQAVQLTIPLVAPLPSSDSALEMMVYTEAGQWLTFDSNAAQNSFGSSSRLAVPNQETTYCPPPTGLAPDQLTATLTEGETCLHIVLTDGGPNDRDGQANGRVLLTATPVFEIEPEPPRPPTPAAPSTIEGSVESLNKTDTDSGGGALSGLALLALVALRISGHANRRSAA